MSITIPAQQIETARYRYTTHLGHAPRTETEIALSALVHELAVAAEPGHEFTKAAIADLVERTLAAATPTLCGCGHEFAEHLGHLGCLAEHCACTARRPHATELTPEGN